MTNLTRPPGVANLVVSRAEAEALVKANPFQRLIEADSGAIGPAGQLAGGRQPDAGYNAFWVDPGLPRRESKANTALPGPSIRRTDRSRSRRNRGVRAAEHERENTSFTAPSPPLGDRCLISFAPGGPPLNAMYNNNIRSCRRPTM